MAIYFNPALPAGCLQQFAGSSIPSGWLECGGQAVSRTLYAALFAAIGTLYGPGDGSTTFNLPDLRGRIGIGRDNMGGQAANRVTTGNSGFNGVDLGAAGGSEVVTLTEAQIPNHWHTTASKVDVSRSGALYIQIGQGPTLIPNGALENLVSGNKGGGQASRVLQPSIVLNWIIKT